MNKHTQGKWKATKLASGNTFIESEDGSKRIAGVGFVSHGVERDEAAANVKLIAAAPEMLANLNLAALALDAAIENAKANGDKSFMGYVLTLDSINHVLNKIKS